MFANLKNKNRAFTIIELLTVMSIIVLLIGLLAPALNQAKRFARKVKQKNQFKAIGNAVEMFRNDFEEYPDSSGDAPGSTGTYAYEGAEKLAEALVGQDLQGFHPDSRFREDYEDSINIPPPLYDRDPTIPGDDPDAENLDSRIGPYLELANAQAHRLWHLYGPSPEQGPGSVTGGNLNRDAFVLCDVYTNVQNNSSFGKSNIGMPILYYKANTSGNMHPRFQSGPGSAFTDPSFDPFSSNPNYIYDHRDNDLLVQLGKPWEGAPTSTNGAAHVMDSRGWDTAHNAPLNQSSAEFFYERTYNESIGLSAGRPHRADSFILQSAGFDGDYGTNDDVFNFPK